MRSTPIGQRLYDSAYGYRLKNRGATPKFFNVGINHRHEISALLAEYPVATATEGDAFMGIPIVWSFAYPSIAEAAG